MKRYTSAMKLTSTFACLAGISSLGLGTARAITTVEGTPYGYITVQTGGQEEKIPVELRQGEKGWIWSVVAETSEYEIRSGGSLNPDPFIAYGIAVVDVGAPSTFGFFFGTPIIATGPSTVVSASIVGGLTDSTGDGVSITPFGQPLLQSASASAPLSSLGVDVGAAFAAGSGAPGSFYSYGPHAAGPIAGPAGIFTFLSTSTAFTLSGGGDIAALTGSAFIDTSRVPDAGPGLAGLMGIGALLFAGTARRRLSTAS